MHLRPIARGLALTVFSVLCAFAAACRSTTAPAEQIITLEVAESRVPCTGAGPQQCLQVRPNAEGPYTLFYDTIRDFAYEPGYHYRIVVGVRAVANPPADGSNREYRLIRVLSKTEVSG